MLESATKKIGDNFYWDCVVSTDQFGEKTNIFLSYWVFQSMTHLFIYLDPLLQGFLVSHVRGFIPLLGLSLSTFDVIKMVLFP